VSYQLASKPIDGPDRSGAVVNIKPNLKLIFYPGEKQVGDTLLGHIYVVGGEGEVYEACGGPAKSYRDGSHTADPTPKGKYHLGPQHHHVTKNWSMSCLAFGTPIRQGAVEYEYQDASGKWQLASGPNGKVTLVRLKECAKELKRSLTKEENDEIVREVRKSFRWRDGTMMDKWWRNDFGEWAWNLPGTACYIHTTPPDEVAWHFKSKDIPLENSHGCVHLHPKDRKEMMDKGYLRQGAYFEVKGYNEKGPP
jgi:hypothetical protein